VPGQDFAFPVHEVEIDTIRGRYDLEGPHFLGAGRPRTRARNVAEALLSLDQMIV
jgi:hypothetical protein